MVLTSEAICRLLCNGFGEDMNQRPLNHQRQSDALTTVSQRGTWHSRRRQSRELGIQRRLSVCLSVCVFVRTIKPKQLKVQSSDLAQGQCITISHPPSNIRSKVKVGMVCPCSSYFYVQLKSLDKSL